VQLRSTLSPKVDRSPSKQSSTWPTKFGGSLPSPLLLALPLLPPPPPLLKLVRLSRRRMVWAPPASQALRIRTKLPLVTAVQRGRWQAGDASEMWCCGAATF